MDRPEFTIHDVLQCHMYSPMQKKSMGKKGDFFEQFKSVMETFDNKDSLIFLVVAEGIDMNPEWAAYVKDLLSKNSNWRVECHGMQHYTHSKESLEKLVKELGEAKKKIEEYLNQKVTLFHPPKDRYGGNVLAAAEALEMRLPEYAYGPIKGVRNLSQQDWLKYQASRRLLDIHYC